MHIPGPTTRDSDSLGIEWGPGTCILITPQAILSRWPVDLTVKSRVPKQDSPASLPQLGAPSGQEWVLLEECGNSQIFHKASESN